MMLPLSQRLGYASGNFGKSLLWTSLDYLLLFYMTEVAGIPVDWAGAIILVSLLWDGAINPFIGYWIDCRAARGQDYRPFLRWAPVFTAISFFALFWMPSEAGAANAVYLLCGLLLFRTIYGLLDVPHNALLAQMPVSSETRTQLAGMRFFFSSLGGLAIALLVAPAFSERRADATHETILQMAGGAGMILCVTMWQSLRPAKLALTERQQSGLALDPRRFLLTILHNRIAVLYLVLAALLAATTPLFAKTLPYLLRYVRLEPGLLPGLLAMLTLGQMVAMPFWTFVSARKGGRFAGILSLSGLAASSMLVMQTLGAEDYILIGATAAFGFFLGGTVILIWGLVGDIADHIAQGAAARADAGLLAFLTSAQKAGIGIGALVAGLILRWNGFVAGEDQGRNAAFAIEAVALLIPMIGALISLAFFELLQKRLSQK